MNAKRLHISLSLALSLLALVGVLALLWTMGDSSQVARAQSVASSLPSHTIAATAGITRYVSSSAGTTPA